MRARIENMVVFLNHEDVPSFQKGGSMAQQLLLGATLIAGQASRIVTGNTSQRFGWRSLGCFLSFSESGYLGLKETILSFPCSRENSRCASICFNLEVVWLGQIIR